MERLDSQRNKNIKVAVEIQYDEEGIPDG